MNILAKSLTEAAYVHIRRDILTCRLVPAEKIKINDLSDRHQVSVQAAREALSRLTSDGLVIAEAQRGFRVAPVSRADLEDLTNTRIEIEDACLRRAIKLGSLEWESNLIAAHHRLLKTAEYAAGSRKQLTEEWVDSHKVFHAALVAGCSSPTRLRIRDALFDQSERYRYLSILIDLSSRNLKEEHSALATAALSRNEKTASRLLREHLAKTAELLIPFVESQNPRSDSQRSKSTHALP